MPDGEHGEPIATVTIYSVTIYSAAILRTENRLNVRQVLRAAA